MDPYNNAPGSGTRNGRSAAGRGAGAGALAGGALFVGLIALCALVISYNGIFQFAEYGGHEGSVLAHAFPAAYTLLLIMACWVSYLLRGAHPRERFWVDLALIPVLILIAAAAMPLSNLELIERVHQGVANVIVAVAPLAALLVAFLLWMTLRAHMRKRRRVPHLRPRPTDDPTTVLHARAVAPEAADTENGEDDGELTARPPHLGPEGLGQDGGLHQDRTEVFSAARSEEDELDGDPSRGREADLWGDWKDEEPVAAQPLPPQRAPEPEPGDDEEWFEASAPALPLPRRSRTGDNPIRRAAEQPPVVPGATAPTGPGSEPEAAAVVPDRLADEGFDHEPLPGDPVSDEAAAPPFLPAPEPEPEREPELEPALGLESDGAGYGPQERFEAGDETVPGPAEPELADTALWEPPAYGSDTGARALSDYVPPVWTPPEEDPPPFAEDPPEPEYGGQEHREPEPAPVLDHDTGPEVRAAFRISGMPPGSARPSDEPVEELLSAGGTGRDRVTEPEQPQSTPWRHRRPVEKRPMVLKPPRPPMPDFTSGPPSQRVRSEPLRPEE